MVEGWTHYLSSRNGLLSSCTCFLGMIWNRYKIFRTNKCCLIESRVLGILHNVEHSVSAFFVKVTSSFADVCCPDKGVLAFVCAHEFSGAELLQLLFTSQRSSAMKSTWVHMSGWNRYPLTCQMKPESVIRSQLSIR